MINPIVITKSHITIVPFSGLGKLKPRSLNKKIVRIALSFPNEWETISIIDKYIKANAHPHLDHFLLWCQILWEFLSIYWWETYRWNIFHYLIKWEIQFRIQSDKQSFIFETVLLNKIQESFELLFVAGQNVNLWDIESDENGQFIEEHVLTCSVVSFEHKWSILCFYEYDTSWTTLFR